jgi:hypothetical protein
VYVRAKVGIVDDRWLTLGSANLNAHSFFSDSEVNVVRQSGADRPPPPARNRVIESVHPRARPSQTASPPGRNN